MSEFGCRRRHARFVVAGSILQIALDVVFGLGELDLLYKLSGILKVAQHHSEHVVHLRNLVSARSQFAYQFNTVLLVEVYSSLCRTITAKVC